VFGLRPLHDFTPPQFASPGLASQAPIRAVKPSATLNVMCHNFEKTIVFFLLYVKIIL